MSGDKLQVGIEKAKSWFVLAQIMAILSGLFFASAGIILTNINNDANNMLSLANSHLQSLNSLEFKSNNLSIDESNAFDSYINISKEIMNISSLYLSGQIKSGLNLLMTYIIIGFILIVLSICFWIFGKHQLNYMERNIF
jgi:preprotein translocase subunit SecG